MKGYSYINNPYFKETKLKCTHTGKYFFDEEFLLDLIEIRKSLDFGMVISSAYRHTTHPIESSKILAGKPPGAHSLGRAIDFRVRGNKCYDLIVECVSREWRIGVSQKGKSRFLHIDNMGTRQGDPKRFANKVWSY